MRRLYVKGLGFIAILTLALVVSGCGNSKKGNGGYGYAPLSHAVASSAGRVIRG